MNGTHSATIPTAGLLDLPTTARRTPRLAEASVCGHWGEILQVGLKDREGRIVTALVTLPDPEIRTRAVATPNLQGIVRCVPEHKTKALQAVRRVLTEWGPPGYGIEVKIESNAPESLGAGSSTGDCTAAALAVLGTLDIPDIEATALEVLESAVFQAEGPCDPLALVGWGFPVLWASREGRLLRVYQRPLPAMVALAFSMDASCRVMTVELARSTSYSVRDLREGAEILRLFEQGLEEGSADKIGRAATWSGSLNQSRCPVPGWDELLKLRERFDASGVSCSHSGSAAALLWQDQPGVNESVRRARDAVSRSGASYIHAFRMGTRRTQMEAF